MMGVSVRYVRKLAAQGKLTFTKDVFGTFNASLAHVEAFMRQRRARAAHAALLRERRDERARSERERVECAHEEAQPSLDEAESFEDAPDTERSACSSHPGKSAARPPAAPAPVLGRLRVEIQGGTLEVFGSEASPPIVIGDGAVIVGRHKRCTIVLDDKTISKLHAAFVATERGVRLRDLGSRNGTYIGSVRVWEVYLTTPARVDCGETQIQFRPARIAGRRAEATRGKTPQPRDGDEPRTERRPSS